MSAFILTTAQLAAALEQASEERDTLLAKVQRLTRERDAALAEVERLRADAERFRWLGKQTNMRIVTDGTVWRHGGGKKSFISWGYIFVNSRGYPGAPTLADLVDVARTDQEDGR